MRFLKEQGARVIDKDFLYFLVRKFPVAPNCVILDTIFVCWAFYFISFWRINNPDNLYLIDAKQGSTKIFLSIDKFLFISTVPGRYESAIFFFYNTYHAHMNKNSCSK